MAEKKPSVLVNLFAVVLLALIFISGILALVAQSGAIPLELEYSGAKLKTSSVALAVMIFCSLCLLSLIGLAVDKGILLFDTKSEQQLKAKLGWLQRFRTALLVLGGAALALGLIGLVLTWGA